MTDSKITVIQGVRVWGADDAAEDLVLMKDEGGLHPEFFFPGSRCVACFDIKRNGEQVIVSEVCGDANGTQRTCTFFVLDGSWFFSTGRKYGDELHQDYQEEGYVCDAGADALTALVRSLSLGFAEEE